MKKKKLTKEEKQRLKTRKENIAVFITVAVLVIVSVMIAIVVIRSLKDSDDDYDDSETTTTVSPAIAETYGSFVYYELSDGTIGIDEYKGNEKTVTVPATINGKEVAYIWMAFRNNTDIEEVYLPNTLLEFVGDSFYGCENLKKVSMYNSVTNIDDNAFALCTSLSELEFFGTEFDFNAIKMGTGNDALISAHRTYKEAE